MVSLYNVSKHEWLFMEKIANFKSSHLISIKYFVMYLNIFVITIF